MWIFHWSTLLTVAVGSFATAWVCTQTGRDPRLGGIVGALLGVLGWFSLISAWAWLYLNRLNPRIVRRPTRWYLWWR